MPTLTPRLAAVFMLPGLAMLAENFSHVGIPPYSRAEELQFRADELKDLASPRGAMATLPIITLDRPKRIGAEGQHVDVNLINWQDAPLEIAPGGGGMTVVSVNEPTRLDGRPMHPGQIIPFSSDNKFGWITNGSISMHLRRGQSGPVLQAFDAQAEPIRSLHALNFYAPSAKYRVTAEWVPIAGGRPLTYERTNGGSTLAKTAPGYVQFQLDGKPYRLYATLELDMIYIVFRDLTSRTETYPSARYLEILFTSRAFDPARKFDPAKRMKFALDFNQAVNPDCAYNPNTHCPIAPPENRLNVAIPAGEKRYHPLD